MTIKACIPVIPSADVEKSLRFWVNGMGLIAEQEMRQDGRLVGCMIHNEHVYFWLNQRGGSPLKPDDYHGISLYWTPTDLYKTRDRLKEIGFDVSDVVVRDYGQTEFFVTDDDGYSHCFGIETKHRAY